MKTRRSLLLALLSLAACADNNASVRVTALCLPPEDPTTCTFSSTCDAQYIGQTIIDVGATNHLWTIVQVDNLLPNNGNTDTFRTNTNDAFVQEYEVEYSGLPFPTATGSVLGSATVPAGGSTVISVLAVNEATAATLTVPAGSYADLVAKLRLKGVYADTTKFETGDFQIPVRVCNGCIGSLTCTLPDVPAYCPPNPGQMPASAKCVTP
jgi:hypothetical protein